MRSVSASCWLSGKQTPSSALCAQSKRLQTPFGITGEWLFPHSCGCPERFGGPAVLAPARGDPSSACRSNLRVSGGVVACPCGLYLSSHSPELTEPKLRACLEDSVNEHSAHCPHTPAFSVTDGTEEKPSLLMSCVACDTWAVIV
uniref:RPA-interacting protein C-terminal domain-containing protein n=1 Tax=Ursus americanus TaxID=9643 RepID=A0A452R9A8_URSAM